jgi:D-alanine-D-alanine ligase
MKLVLAFNVNKSQVSLDLEDEAGTDFDTWEVINGIKQSLERIGNKVELVEADNNAFERLKAIRERTDLVFNIAEGLSGDARESQIPIFCEMLKLPYTHSGPTTNAIKMDKTAAKMVVASAGFKVPRTYGLEEKINYPVIVKPNSEGSSIGIWNDSVVNNKPELERAVNRLKSGYLIEDFIDGEEIAVGMLGNSPREILPIIRQKWDFMPQGYQKIAGYESKWMFETKAQSGEEFMECPAKIAKSIEQRARSQSEEIFNLLQVRDCARIDYRVDSKGEIYFLEVNTMPGLINDAKSPSYFVFMARKAGYNYDQLLGKIVEAAKKRYKME